MKFFALTTIAIVLLISTARSQVKYSIFGGPQVTSANYSVEGVKQKTSYKPGVQLGLGMKVPFEVKLYFAPVLYYSMKGYKARFTRFANPPDLTATDNNTVFHNIEAGFLFQYDFNEKPSHMFFKLGPSLDFQYFGKEKFNTPGGLVKRKIPYAYDQYGHFGANLVFHLGYEMGNGVFIFGQYSHGLANINNADAGPNIQHRAFGISIGKYIAKGKYVW
jgi:hypothetical protein